ncbi:nucleoside hydrolase [Vitiosangium sp. GDMCC 1.1324]|uniref:nucleoside hydrolase n=1 Tax=Vitiosangium sp. (strain GDMCC 1.1324) TaxID=2138576 RepID=UPI00130DCF77|nr:nucleoside hydrolase [Vitiosangium sp. GDMCC 1.1324]
MAHRILIDTAPGVDDAIALLLALSSKDLDVVGITTTFGNIDTKRATRNVLSLLELCGRSDLPVAVGAPRALSGTRPRYARHVHGRNGLGGFAFPQPHAKPLPLSAAEFIVRMVMAAPGELTLVTFGPLTNLSLALELEPRLGEKVAAVVTLGGALEVPGNVTASAETHLFNDPPAAARVLAAGWPLTLVGLDVTSQVVMTPAYLQSLRHSGQLTGELIWNISRFSEAFHYQHHGLAGLYSHAPTALAYVLAPELFTLEESEVHVRTQGPERGRTTRQPIPPGLLRRTYRRIPQVCIDVDAERVLELVRDQLRPPAASPPVSLPGQRREPWVMTMSSM